VRQEQGQEQGQAVLRPDREHRRRGVGDTELVANNINLLLDQIEASTDGVTPSLNFSGMTGNPDHFVNFGL
jgi:hypothetical protein